MTTLISTTPVVSIVNRRAVTTSKAIADYFHKQHKNVLQKIDALAAELPAEWYELNFKLIQIEVDLGAGRTRKDPAREITRDGFTLLAMGFTGKQALVWKLQYIEAFNAMELALTAPAQPRERLTPAQQRTLQEAVAARTAGLSDQQKHLAFPKLWGGVKTTFRVPSYKELEQSQFEDALSFVQHYPLEGELLLKETTPAPAASPLSELAYPVDQWLEANPAIAKTQTLYGAGNLMICFGDIHQSAISQLLNELTSRGINVEACRLEYRALFNQLTAVHSAIDVAHRALARTATTGLRIGKHEYH